MIIQARYVVPADRDPIENGAIFIEGGRIAAVGARSELGRPTGASVVDYDDAVILPGFVNAHTHLELSHMAGRTPVGADGPRDGKGSPFVRWITQLTLDLVESPPDREQVERAVRAGIEQSIRSGVTAVGDITRRPDWTRPVLADSILRALSFGEVIAIGRNRDNLGKCLEAAAGRGHASERVTFGISPHAPYSVEPKALAACATAAQSAGLPVCIHLAESSEESEFTRAGSGPLVDFLKSLGVWDEQVPVGGASPVELVREAGLLNGQCLLAHCNYVTDGEIEVIAGSGSSVIYCPRTHAVFGNPPHRFRDMLAAGINVCVGTDSLASNPSLSILEELRFLHQMYPAFSPDILVRMGTAAGAQALGLAGDAGSIAPGKPADLCVVPLDPAGGWQRVLAESHPPRAVYIHGEIVAEE